MKTDGARGDNETPDTNPRLPGQSTSDEGGEDMKGGEDSLFNRGVGQIGQVHANK